jgi:hypothetical protein
MIFLLYLSASNNDYTAYIKRQTQNSRQIRLAYKSKVHKSQAAIKMPPSQATGLNKTGFPPPIAAQGQAFFAQGKVFGWRQIFLDCNWTVP